MSIRLTSRQDRSSNTMTTTRLTQKAAGMVTVMEMVATAMGMDMATETVEMAAVTVTAEAMGMVVEMGMATAVVTAANPNLSVL
jgi:hypothetical protein